MKTKLLSEKNTDHKTFESFERMPMAVKQIFHFKITQNAEL